MKKQIISLIDLLVIKGVPFAVYRLPDTEKLHIVVQQSMEVKKVKITDLDGLNGFVIAPFESAQTEDISLLQANIKLENNGDYEALKKWLLSLPDHPDVTPLQSVISSRKDYLDRATYLIEKLKTTEFQKIVFSRIVEERLTETFSPAAFFRKLEKKYKAAFVCIFKLPDSNTWIGASPESLLSIDDKNCKTMALAGTRKLDDLAVDPVWNDKEIEEQEFVSQFIEDQLSELSIHDYQKEGPSVVAAGSLAHLKTDFTIQRTALEAKAGKFVLGLHPTPAVCGLPKADAYRMIQKAEQHERRYYTGFYGPWQMNGQSNLFVNLRCAELGNKWMHLYVGGGLTASSEAAAEWEETVQKSQTLLSVAKKL